MRLPEVLEAGHLHHGLVDGQPPGGGVRLPAAVVEVLLPAVRPAIRCRSAAAVRSASGVSATSSSQRAAIRSGRPRAGPGRRGRCQAVSASAAKWAAIRPATGSSPALAVDARAAPVLLPPGRPAVPVLQQVAHEPGPGVAVVLPDAGSSRRTTWAVAASAAPKGEPQSVRTRARVPPSSVKLVAGASPLVISTVVQVPALAIPLSEPRPRPRPLATS